MVSSQLHYTKVNRFMPFLLAEILNFQGSIHRIGVGSFSYKEIHAEKEMQDPDSIYSFYKKLVELRKEKAVISEGTIEFFERENADVLAYKRNYKEEELVVFNNLTGGKIVLQTKSEWKTYHKLLGNYEKEYEIENGGEIILEPYETLVLEK